MATTTNNWEKRLNKSLGQRLQLEALLADSSGYRFQYPWLGLEEKLVEAGEDKLSMIGYGSLLNPESAALTIGDTPKHGHPPVIAFGAMRLFNYVMPQEVIDRYSGGDRYPQRMCAALNTRFTGRVEDVLNGRVITLDAKDLNALREREKGYDLMPVSFVPWENVDLTPRLGFVLCATERPWNGSVFVSKDVEPFPPYLQICRDGVAMVSPEFHQCFLHTTMMADGVCKLAKWCQDEGN